MGTGAGGRRGRYIGIMRRLEEGYGAVKTMEGYEAVFREQLGAVRRMRDRKALRRLDACINSVLNARKEALDRVSQRAKKP